jgi:EpsI family protein
MSPARLTPAWHAGLLLALVTLTSLAADWLTPRARMADLRSKMSLSDVVPRQLGPWTLDPWQAVVPPSPDVQASLDAAYTEVLGRTYVNTQGDRIMLSLAYVAQSTHGAMVHRPEVCYPAQGFAVRDVHDARIDVGNRPLHVVRAVMARQGRSEPVTYWIVVGNRAVASRWAVRWAQLTYSLQGTLPDALLVRVSSIDRDAAHAFAMHDRFVEDLEHVVAMPQRPRLFGALATEP